MGRGPHEVVAACEVAVAAVTGAADDLSGTSGSRGEWGDAVRSLQRVIDVASAAQDAAIARLAAVEPEVLEDGTVVESHRAPGHVALDAAAIVSGVLSVSAVHAERRVRGAVRLAADGPVGSASHTGLGGLHAAMATGRLDGYRAGVLAEELEAAPAPVRATVVAALAAHFEGADGAHLRRRCRRVLARISPDLLRQRAVRARSQCSLRRWVQEPGVDRWEGTFPSEEAAQAWAAIDALARRYVAAGVCARVERARAKALTDLVAGRATIETVVTVTVPAAALPQPGLPGTAGADAVADRGAGASPDEGTGVGVGGCVLAGQGAGCGEGDLVEVTGLSGGQPVLVSRPWLAATLGTPGPSTTTVSAGPATAAASGEPGRAGEHVPGDPATARDDAPGGPGVTGVGGSARVTLAECHPLSGALLDIDPKDGTGISHHGDTDTRGGTATQSDTGAGDADAPVAWFVAVGADRYRPSRRLARLVRARDRRCRFPGCTVAAVFCDLDHVRPWPAGATCAENLICLCRRHHRIKQRPGWAVVLTRDGVATWTDPTGRVRTTVPVDALHVTLLSGTPAPAAATSTPRTVVPDGPHSHLEYTLEHLGAGTPSPAPGWRDHRGRHRTEVTTPRSDLVLARSGHWRCARSRPRGECRQDDGDPPPF